VVVTEKLVAVPVELQTTPPEPLKPGSVLHAPEAYVLLSTKYASWAVAALRASDATRALKPRERYAANCGIAIAARMPMIATTTSNSISVKPLDRLRPAFCVRMDSSSFRGAVGGPARLRVHAACRPESAGSSRPGRGTFGASCPTPRGRARRGVIRRAFSAVMDFGRRHRVDAGLGPARPPPGRGRARAFPSGGRSGRRSAGRAAGCRGRAGAAAAARCG